MGEGSPPESVESEKELLARVAKTPGAIGFVRSDMTDDSVKVLAIISDSNGSK
jgi:ABC-type phosphate transport system substrate-binding protein